MTPKISWAGHVGTLLSEDHSIVVCSYLCAQLVTSVTSNKWDSKPKKGANFMRSSPPNTVNFIVFGTLHCFWDSGYLCHFSTEIAEIWFPGTFFKDVWAYKISAQNLLYFRSYKIFSGGKSEAKIGLELRELKFITKYWCNLSVSEPSSVSVLSVLNYGLWH